LVKFPADKDDRIVELNYLTRDEKLTMASSESPDEWGENKVNQQGNATGGMKVMEKDDLARLAHALIELCIEDGDESVTLVSERLTTIQDNLMQAKYEMERLSRIGESSKSNHMIVSRVKSSIDNMNEAFVSLQFFDRISQRMDHANRFLKALHDQEDGIKFDQGSNASEALVALYNGLTMEDERVLYRAIEQGDSISGAINKAKTDGSKNVDDGGDIELF